MDTKKQKLLIEYLLSSPDTFTMCSAIIQPEFFDPELRNSVKFIQQYWEKYNTTPDNTQIEAETNIKFNTQPVPEDKIQYCADEVEIFCKRKAIEKAIISSPKLIEQGDYGTVEKNIRDAITLSLHRDLGLRYFENPEDRLNRMAIENPVQSTGWKEVDDLLFGGLSRKEMILFAGNSGSGKSVTLANLGLNFVEQNLNVLFISLELDKDVVAQRFDTMITGIGRRDWKNNINEIATRVTAAQEGCGDLDIVHMSSGTKANEIRAYLKEYYLHYDMLPDLVIVDYLDKMSPNEHVSADNVFEKDKRCSEQLRDIAVDMNLYMATASQLNRSAVGADHHDHSQIAGGISKINETDIYISLIMTDTMRATGDMIFVFQKTRNSDGVGKMLYLKWVNKFLRIKDADSDNSPNNNSGLSFKSSQEKTNDLIDMSGNKKVNSLLDLMK